MKTLKMYECEITPSGGKTFRKEIEATDYLAVQTKIAQKYGGATIRVIDIWVGDRDAPNGYRKETPDFRLGPHFDKTPRPKKIRAKNFKNATDNKEFFND